MNEHRIHLRRAWTGEFAGGNRRVDLPISWKAGEIPICLRRGFQRPRIDDAREVLGLEMHDLAGLVAVRLNGRDLDVPSAGDVPPDAWRDASNELVLELDPLRVPTGEEWGRVTLVIRPI